MSLTLIAVVIGWYALFSTVTFAAYAYDKRQARTSAWRVKERALHGLELLGGWPGAFAGQRAFRHKLRKRDFMVVFWLIVAAHGLVWTAAAYLLW